MKSLFRWLVALFLLIALMACYQVPKTTDKMGVLFSPNIVANGYFGRAIAVVGNWAFIGDPNSDAKAPDDSVKREGGLVRVLHYDQAESKWGYAYDADRDPISFTSNDIDHFDAFGSALYFAEGEQHPDRRFLMVAALLDDTKYGDVPAQNNGSVYFYQLPTEEELNRLIGCAKSDLSSYLPQLKSKISLDKDDCSNLQPGKDYMSEFLPSVANGTALNVGEEIPVSKINPGIGFGFNVRYDADAEVLVVGAPYESYYKDIQMTGNLILLNRPGAAYVFEPAVAGDYSSWHLKARLMPMWNQPQYTNQKYYDSDLQYLGETVVPVMDGGSQKFVTKQNDRAEYYFGENIAVLGDTIAVGVPNAAFQYFRKRAAGSPSNGKWYDSTKNEIAAPSEAINKYTEQNQRMGSVYVYHKVGTDWKFSQRCDRLQFKEQYKNTYPGSYITDSDDFYQYGYYDDEGLGQSVVIYGDYILAGIPRVDKTVSGTKDVKIFRTWNDIGAIAFFKKYDSSPSQLSTKIQKSEILNNNYPLWSDQMVRRKDILAVAAVGTDYLAFQKDCGRVFFYKIAEDGSSISEITGCNEVTTKELTKGYQRLGKHMDFSSENNQVICGVPDLGINIYYDNPYVSKYWLPNCGAIYTFKWKN